MISSDIAGESKSITYTSTTTVRLLSVVKMISHNKVTPYYIRNTINVKYIFN